MHRPVLMSRYLSDSKWRRWKKCNGFATEQRMTCGLRHCHNNYRRFSEGDWLQHKIFQHNHVMQFVRMNSWNTDWQCKYIKNEHVFNYKYVLSYIFCLLINNSRNKIINLADIKHITMFTFMYLGHLHQSLLLIATLRSSWFILL